MKILKKDKKQEKTTDIVLLLDKSGSMSTLKNDTLGSLKTFIEEQKKAKGKANFTLILFSSEYDYNVQFSCNIKDCPEIIYNPSGQTALLDAIGKTVEGTIARIKDMKNKPDKVILAILTDGEENSSKEYKFDAIKKIIETQEKEEKWDVIYLGANQNAIKVANNIGIQHSKSMTYGANLIGTQNVMKSLSRGIAEYRSSAESSSTCSSLAFNDLDRDDQVKAGVSIDLNKKI